MLDYMLDNEERYRIQGHLESLHKALNFQRTKPPILQDLFEIQSIKEQIKYCESLLESDCEVSSISETTTFPPIYPLNTYESLLEEK